MGNKEGKYGNVYVQTEKPYYISGDVVNGVVYLVVNEAFPGNTIHLKIKGIEESSWREEKSKQIVSTDPEGKQTIKHEKYFEDYQGKNIFFFHKIKLYNWQNITIQPGQYSFPFQFLLQNHLPGTFNQVGTDYKAKIKYKIKAECEPLQKGVTKLKHAQDIVIHEPVKGMQTQIYGEMDVNAKVFCCFSKGVSHLKCFFERNCYTPGETANIMVEIDNRDCQLDVSNITCRLNNTVKLTSNDNHTKIISRDFIDIDYPGVKAGEAMIQDNAIKIPLQLVNTKDKKREQIQATANGKYVSCQYILEVSAKFSGCSCCTSNPIVQIPLQLVAPPPINYGQIQTPQNWNPQLYAVKLIQFNSQDMYTGNYQENIQVYNNMQHNQMQINQK